MKKLDDIIPITLWLLVELERDRRNLPRRDIRDGCQAAEELFKWYGKSIPWETIRRHYNAIVNT